MPPKQSQSGSSVAVPTIPVWAVRLNTDVPPSSLLAWTPYSISDCEAIERAYPTLKTASVSGGEYLVDTRQMRQFNAKDKLKQREVRRFVADEKLLGYFAKNRQGLAPPPSRGAGAQVRDVDHQNHEATPLYAKRPRAEPEEEGRISGSCSIASKNFEYEDSSFSLCQPRKEGRNSSRSSSSISPPAPILARSTGGAFRVFLPHGDKAAPSHVFAAIADVLQRVEPISRLSLSTAAEKMHQVTRNWLRQLGRPADQKGTAITLPVPLQSLPSAKRVPITSGFTATAGDLQFMCSQAAITYVGKKRPDAILRQPSAVSPSSSSLEVDELNDTDYLETQKLMVSGPAMVLYDSNYDCLKSAAAGPSGRQTLPTVIICSIPGINFAYSATDTAAFTNLAPADDTDDDGADEGGGDSQGRRRRRRVVSKDKAMRRMEVIWDHVLRVMDSVHRCEYAVLCAIGCGAFKGPYGSVVTRLWAAALHRVLGTASKPFKHLKAVFLSLPTFGADNNFGPFAAVLSSGIKQSESDSAAASQGSIGLQIPLILIEDASMMAIAVHLTTQLGSKTSKSPGQQTVVGILNPSDVLAIRRGWIGMYWDGGHIALEELMALQTTMLTQHVGLNRELFTTPERWLPSGSIDDD
jgi:hypothetical protein